MTAHPLESGNPAALPWYNFPATRHSLDSVWGEAAAELRTTGYSEVPRTLDHEIPYNALYSYPRLTLSQCCGLDLFAAHTADVEPFAAPVISGLAACAGKYYSHIVTRPGANLDNPRVAINNSLSHSGHTAILGWLANQGVGYYTTSLSGSHARSILALRRGHADLAAIDALSWQHLDTTGLHILDSSAPAQAPPFITGRESGIPLVELTAVLDRAFKRFGKSIGIIGVVPISRSEYRGIYKSAVTHGILLPTHELTAED